MEPMMRGEAGLLYIPDVSVSLPLYYKGKLSLKKSQAIVDRENSGIYAKNFGGGHCDYIGDHAAQGFDAILKCKLYDPAIVQGDNYSQLYQCVAIMPGTNVGSNLITCCGQKLTKIKWADLCCYTCNDMTGKNITMVFFKKTIRYNYPIYPTVMASTT